MQKIRPYIPVDLPKVCFGEIIFHICESWVVRDINNFLCFMTYQPKISHFHSFGSMSLDGIIDHAHGSFIVNMDGG